VVEEPIRVKENLVAQPVGKWMRDYNFQKHMAREERQDGCHSPAEFLGWVKGMRSLNLLWCIRRSPRSVRRAA